LFVEKERGKGGRAIVLGWLGGVSTIVPDAPGKESAVCGEKDSPLAGRQRRNLGGQSNFGGAACWGPAEWPKKRKRKESK